jgi:MFS family permease
LIFSVLNGILFSVFETLAKKIISDFTFDNNKSIVFNFRITVINLGAILGPFLKIFIFKELSTLIFVLMFIYFAYGLLILIFYKNTQNTMPYIFDIKAFEAIKFLWKDKITVFLLIGGIFTFSGIAHLNSTIPQYFIKKGLYINYGKMDLYSILLLINSITFIFMQYVILPFLKKKRFFSYNNRKSFNIN